MKQKILTTVAAVAMCAMSFAQDVKVNAQGNMGIGRNPTTTDRLIVDGGALRVGYTSSDTDRAKNMIRIGDGPYIQIGEWEVDDKLSFKASAYNFTNGYVGIGLASTTAPLTKFQIGDIWTFYDGTGDKEICRNARFAGNQYWRINTGASSLISFTVNGDIFFRTSPSGTSGAAIPLNDVVIKSNGNFGIGVSPQEKLHIDLNDAGRKVLFDGWTDAYIDLTGECGSMCFYPSTDWYLHLGKSTTAGRIGKIHCHEIHYVNGVWKISDSRLKENIVKLDNPMDKLKRISTYTYTLKQEFIGNVPPSVKEKYAQRQIGFLAQELEKEFPELVNRPDSTNEFYSVDYVGMVPILLEAIKEQQSVIENLQREVQALQKEEKPKEEQTQCNIESLLQRIETLEKVCSSSNTLKSGDASIGSTSSLTTSSATTNTATQELYLSDNANSETMKLYQNAPNPFNQRTTITCYVPQNIQKVQLCVYNMQGIQVQCLSVTERGNVELHIEAGALSSGVYSYVLIGDGAASETKQMILTK